MYSTYIDLTVFFTSVHLGQGLGHLEMTAAGHSPMSHTTRAHPETVSVVADKFINSLTPT